MPSKIPQFTLRVDPALMEKFRYVAAANMRSANREAELVFTQHVEEFEKAHGEITDTVLARCKK